MATTATGIEVPAGGDAFDPQGDMVDLANSLRSRIRVPVANGTARTSLLAAITWAPSALEPLRVWREDLGVEEMTTNGSTWRRTTMFAEAAGIATFPSATATTHIVNATFPSGMFTQPPVVTATLVGDASVTAIILNVYSVTTSGCQLAMVNSAGTAFSSPSRRAHWRASQATSGSATG